MDIQHNFINAAGVKIHYLSAGQGDKTVVLLHGGGLDTAELSWGGFMQEVTQDFRLIAPDWPGYGLSDKPDVRYTISYYIEVLREFLKVLGIQRVSLVGISMGGAISIGFTLQNPDAVQDLVLVDSYGLQRKLSLHFLSYIYVRTPGVRPLTYWLLKQRWFIQYSLRSILKRPGAISAELVDMIHQQVMIPGVARAFSDLQDSDVGPKGLKTVYLERLPEIKARTLIIHGGKDGLVPLVCSREAETLIPGARMYVMEGCGHWPQRDHPEEFERVVGEFLA
jgi:pimeloyl-ACP methyl ester carboxylesterase